MAARNTVQFQKGLSEAAFRARYGTEERCREAVAAMRWPHGFVCPACGGTEYTLVTTRHLYQCCRCRHQASLTAGTIFHASKLPLTGWFQAMYHLTQSKTGISSLELARRLGVTQTTAWTLKHKLLQVMLEREAEKPLSGRVEIDDADLGGEQAGGKRGRGAPVYHRSLPPSRRQPRANRFASSYGASRAFDELRSKRSPSSRWTLTAQLSATGWTASPR